MNIREATAAVVAATWVVPSASVAALALLALAPSSAVAQDTGPVDQSTLRNIELVNDLERALRQAEAARLSGDCDRLETFTGLFYGMHMRALPAETAADYQRRWSEISERPCPPKSAGPPPPPQAMPDEVSPAPANGSPPAEDIPTYDAEPAPPGYGNKDPTIGIPYRDPTDPMIIPLPPPKKVETDPPPPETTETDPPPPKKRPR